MTITIKEGIYISQRKRKSNNKVRGFRGFFRLILTSVGLSIYFILFSIAAWLISRIIAIPFWHLYLWVIGTYCLIGTLSVLGLKRYFLRPITEEEYNSFLKRNLIHYTDYLSEQGVSLQRNTGFVHLVGNGSRRANYSMKWKDAGKKFTWFHLSEVDQGEEPTFTAFWENHSSESLPRAYKVVIPFADLQVNRMYIRPSDKAIGILGNVSTAATLYESFRWYNEKIHVSRCLLISPEAISLIPFIAFRQLCGTIIDFITNPKRYYRTITLTILIIGLVILFSFLIKN
ncbi:hypothetical protein [Paenibacillus sp. NPDC058071]|uniref:hypothetical protein n=1 Tax=Paenibacillus sp. NPDC058071 TaxID=3346326 RepID=UPI0036D8F061